MKNLPYQLTSLVLGISAIGWHAPLWAQVSINDSIDAPTTINTGSSTGAVTIGNAANSTSINSATTTIGSANATNSMSGASNTLAASATNTISAGTGNVLTAVQQNQLSGGTGNTITATGGSNTIAANAAGQSNSLFANGTNGANNLSANGTSGSNDIEAKNNNLGVATANSTNTIGNTGSGTSVTARGGSSTLSVAGTAASLTAGPTLATNGTTGATSGNLSGGLTVHNTAQTITVGTSIPATLSPNGILAGKTYQNKVNGNLLVDGNVYINGTTDFVSSNTANTTVVGSTTGVGASILPGATVANNGGTAIVLRGASAIQTVVDANGKLTNVAVASAAQSSAAMTLTNGYGNTHGLVITETQTTLSGGTSSSSLTLGDNGGTFSDSSTGAPVQVHGVNDGTTSFDAVNVRQFAGAIASVTAMANIPQVDPNKTVAIGVGLGGFMGKTALAVGLTYRFASNGILKGSVSSNTSGRSKTAVGIGAAWSY